MDEKFQAHLRNFNLSENALTSYLWTVNYYLSHYGEFTKEELLEYKSYLLENFKPKTINLRIQALNRYFAFVKKEKLQLKFIKVQQKSFLENVISSC